MAIFATALTAALATFTLILERHHLGLSLENSLLRQQLWETGHLQKKFRKAVVGTAQKLPVESVAPFDWSMIAKGDLKAFISNLQSVGCPLETVRDIVSLELKKSFTSRKWALIQTVARKDFWAKDFQPGIQRDSDVLASLRELDAEFNSTYMELLGSCASEQHFLIYIEPLESELAGTYYDLESAKMETIKNHCRNLSSELGRMSPTDPRRIEVCANCQRQIETELTPEQLEDYDLRTSEVARNLRASIPKESPLTEPEFRAAFRALRNTAIPSSRSEVPPVLVNQALRARLLMQ